MHMALASCSSLAAADAAVRFFPASMAYHRHPCSGGGGLSSSTFFGAAAAAFPQQPAFGPADLGLAAPPQLRDAFERLLSDEGVSSVAVPGTFGTTPPPPRPPRMSFLEQVVPDASAYAHASRGATAVAGERSTTRTATDDRIAFRVRSEEEVLDDGYKWRKYGKKSVKNSPNPRNYYRCSTEGCNVKKRVERDRDDPSYVVTMYEGVHNHVSPGTIYYATQDVASGRFFVAGMHQFGLN